MAGVPATYAPGAEAPRMIDVIGPAEQAMLLAGQDSAASSVAAASEQEGLVPAPPQEQHGVAASAPTVGQGAAATDGTMAAAVKLEPAAPSVTSAAPQADEPKPVVAKQPAPPIGLDEMFAKAKKELYNYDPPREGQAPIDWASVQRDFEDCCRGAVERAVARGENLVPGCRLYIEVA